MVKRLQDMTLEELWQLFPIELVPHNPLWESMAADEINCLYNLLAPFNPEFAHIGSTAIPVIMAKPIVDILVEVSDAGLFQPIRGVMENAGYLCMAESEQRMSFNKGYTPQGYANKVFHIHVHLKGDNDEIRFRDYLLTHPESAARYESLKIRLATKFRYNRDAYTAAKSDFISQILRKT